MSYRPPHTLDETLKQKHSHLPPHCCEVVVLNQFKLAFLSSRRIWRFRMVDEATLSNDVDNNRAFILLRGANFASGRRFCRFRLVWHHSSASSSTREQKRETFCKHNYWA